MKNSFHLYQISTRLLLFPSSLIVSRDKETLVITKHHILLLKTCQMVAKNWLKVIVGIQEVKFTETDMKLFTNEQENANARQITEL